MERSTPSTSFGLGSPLPEFSLPCVDGTTVSDEFLRRGAVSLVVFGCNHCPYVVGSEETLIATVRAFLPRGLRAVMISSNDAGQYPEDSFQKMQEHAISRQLPYPYLYDETQQVAKLFDAACTPECYLFDANKRLVFHGPVTDKPRSPAEPRDNIIEQAIRQALEGLAPNPAFVHPIGCSIKWKQG